MLYAGVGHFRPTRLAPEGSPFFSVPGGSLGDLACPVWEAPVNGRLDGLGCHGSRTCAPCAAAALDRNRREGTDGLRGGTSWLGLGSAPPQDNLDGARNSLLIVSSYAVQAADALAKRDRNTAVALINAIAAIPDLGWDELVASKNEAATTLGNALAEIDRGSPGWWSSWMGTPPQQVDAFVGAARAVATRMHARASQDDMTMPADFFSTDEQEAIDSGEAAWSKKVEEDEKKAKVQQCNPAAYFAGEVSALDYAGLCAPKFDLGIFGTVMLVGAAVILGSVFLVRR